MYPLLKYRQKQNIWYMGKEQRERERERRDRQRNWFPLHQRLRIMRVTIYAHKGNKAYESTLYQT